MFNIDFKYMEELDEYNAEVDELLFTKLYYKYLKFFNPNDKKSLLFKEYIEKFYTLKQNLNYEEIFMEYNNAFFFRNLLKCIISINYLKNNLSIAYSNIIDLGSGVGTASIAIDELYGNFDFKFKLIDKSKKQISLAKDLNKGRANFTFLNKDESIEKILANENNSLILASYYFCEQNDFNLENIRFSSNSLLVIDYEVTINVILEQIPDCEVVRIKFAIKLPNKISLILQQDELKINALYIKR